MIRDKDNIRNRIQKFLMLVLIIIILIMLFYVERFAKVGRLINYAGFARGGAQRYVKLRLFGRNDRKLLEKNNKILEGLSNGDEELRLTKIDDKKFREKLEKQVVYWNKLYNDTEAMSKAHGYEKENLRIKVLRESEEYFKIANDTTYAAEDYSEKLAAHMGIVEIILAAVAVGITGLVIMDYTDKKNLVKMNIRLGAKAYIDAHTGLPNKSRCEEVFNDRSVIKDDICCIMFDLNGLKEVNDRLGHIAGDELIKGFAEVLKTSVRENDFVGRYGGDEFVGVIYNPGSDGLTKIFERIKYNVKIFNERNPELRLSYAYGYASSIGKNGYTMKMLLSEADDDMYRNKGAMKKGSNNLDYIL